MDILPFYNISKKTIKYNICSYHMNNTLSNYGSDTTIDSDDVPTYSRTTGTSDYSFELFSDIDPDLNLNTNITNSCKYYSYEQFNGTVSSIQAVSFIHFNARSLHATISEIRESLDMLKLNFDIIAVSETWLKNDSAQY